VLLLLFETELSEGVERDDQLELLTAKVEEEPVG
jgi:hypothetical protein